MQGHVVYRLSYDAYVTCHHGSVLIVTCVNIAASVSGFHTSTVAEELTTRTGVEERLATTFRHRRQLEVACSCVYVHVYKYKLITFTVH